MAKRLYVGGLPWATNDETLRAGFSNAGTVVSANVIMDKMTGRSKGFGFVEMSTDEEAQNAIAMFDGKDFEGRKITVNEAKPMTERSDRGPRRDFGGRGQSEY